MTFLMTFLIWLSWWLFGHRHAFRICAGTENNEQAQEIMSRHRTRIDYSIIIYLSFHRHLQHNNLADCRLNRLDLLGLECGDGSRNPCGHSNCGSDGFDARCGSSAWVCCVGEFSSPKRSRICRRILRLAARRSASGGLLLRFVGTGSRSNSRSGSSFGPNIDRWREGEEKRVS